MFLTEMWEQFSYYGMRALLVYYMIHQLRFEQHHASLVYGVYTAFIFLTPIFGGIACDRYLGRRKSVVTGGLMMSLGHFMLASEALFYPALGMIALGNGLFQPSLPSQIRDLYAPDDPRQGNAYYVYYVGINLGGFLAPLICGTLGETLGWHWGFAAAGVGMLLGLATFVLGRATLPPDPLLQPKARGGIPLDPVALRRTLRLFAGVAAAVVVFRSAYEQLGNTFALWAEQGVDRHIGGFVIPMTWFQSLNPLFVFLFTPLLLRFRLTKGHGPDASPSTPTMALGAMTVGAGYLVLIPAAMSGGEHGTHWSWLVFALALLTLGELFILPVGLGLFGRLAPAGFAATSIAAWFGAGFAGNLAAGAVGTLWQSLSTPQFFALIASICAVAALLLWQLRGFARSAEKPSPRSGPEASR
ncbi:MFS transporter [Novosphingobium sp. PC22D]|nr:MFS transporter [Novosphingobium sp. PC22D]